MKLAIVTLHRVYNYGSVLQAYATQRAFEREGCETVIVDYITPRLTKRRRFLEPGAKPNISGIKKTVYRLAKAGSIFLKEQTFGGFIKKNLKLTGKYITADDLEKHPPIADIYVTGSDQTWNSAYNEGVDRGFFLDFIPEDKKRIAFVASFGKEKLDETEIASTKEYIMKYSRLSVREDSAVQILNDLGRYDAVQLIDPTLQLDKGEWLALASKRRLKERYLILMLLYNEDNHATDYARKIADERGLLLVKLCWDMKRPPEVDILMTHRSPADFLSLFYYADFVVTNSFHGLAFSINLEKQFVVVPRNEYNSRIDSLLRLCELTQRQVFCYEDVQRNVATVIDYAKVNLILKKEREKARKFILDAVSEVTNENGL